MNAVKPRITYPTLREIQEIVKPIIQEIEKVYPDDSIMKRLFYSLLGSLASYEVAVKHNRLS